MTVPRDLSTSIDRAVALRRRRSALFSMWPSLPGTGRHNGLEECKLSPEAAPPRLAHLPGRAAAAGLYDFRETGAIRRRRAPPAI